MTQDLAPDEKRCPYCAEVIRAAAVKCRYCHSDLPVAPEPESVPHPAFAPPTGLGAGEPAAPTGTSAVLGPAMIAMLVLSLVLSLGIAGVWWSARPDDLRTAGNGQVTSTSYRSAAMSAAAANAATVLSYGYKTLAADEKAARAVLTAAFAKKYAGVMKKAGPKAIAAKLTLKATVVSTALISLQRGSAKVLLFVNTVTTTTGSAKQQLNQNRVLMTMTRQDGDWIVSKLSPF